MVCVMFVAELTWYYVVVYDGLQYSVLKENLQKVGDLYYAYPTHLIPEVVRKSK